MKNINNKLIVFGLEILAILGVGIAGLPTITFATPGYVDGYSNPVTWNEPTQISNPKPGIRSINPRSGDRGENVKTITITGSGFVPSSVARVNGSNRPTTFIDFSHLMVQVSAEDMYNTDGFFITVFNKSPDGGYSNAIFFTLNDVVVPAMNNNTNTNNNYSNTNRIENGTNNESYNGLAANVVYGSNGFLPSSLIQWIFFGIIILIIVILVRKIFGADKKYQASPMKHA